MLDFIQNASSCAISDEVQIRYKNHRKHSISLIVDTALRQSLRTA